MNPYICEMSLEKSCIQYISLKASEILKSIRKAPLKICSRHFVATLRKQMRLDISCELSPSRQFT